MAEAGCCSVLNKKSSSQQTLKFSFYFATVLELEILFYSHMLMAFAADLWHAARPQAS
jgi:hypothetical protein